MPNLHGTGTLAEREHDGRGVSEVSFNKILHHLAMCKESSWPFCSLEECKDGETLSKEPEEAQPYRKEAIEYGSLKTGSCDEEPRYPK